LIGRRDMVHTIADCWRLPVWTMLQTGRELWVGLAPEFHLHYQVADMAALAQCGKRHGRRGSKCCGCASRHERRRFGGFSTQRWDFAADSLYTTQCRIADATDPP